MTLPLKKLQTRAQSEIISNTTITTTELEEEKEGRKSSVDIGLKDFISKKKKNKLLRKDLEPILSKTENLSPDKLNLKTATQRNRQKNEGIECLKKKNDIELASPSLEDIQYTTNGSNSTDSGQPMASFSLSYVNGYDGKTNRYCAKNILHLTNSKIIFPAANIAVLMSTESSEQGFFTGHTNIVSALCLHPGKRIVASGQSGGLILVWDAELLKVKERMSESHMQLNEYEDSHQNIECLSFSVDGIYLVALISGGSESSKRICVFKWEDGVSVASALVGHLTIQVSFNPYKYRSHENSKGTAILNTENDDKNDKISKNGKNDRRDSSEENDQNEEIDQNEMLHSLVSCGGRVIKFWALRQKRVRDNFNSNKNSTALGQDGYRTEYTLDGRYGVWPGGTQFNTCDLTCFTFASCHDNMTNYQNGLQSHSSRVLCGSSTGSIFIWEQTEERSIGISGKTGLILKEKLLSVVTDVHDGPVFDIDYHCNSHNHISDNDSNNNDEDDEVEDKEEDKDDVTKVLREHIITCGVDGVVNLWLIAQIQSTPLEHLASYSLSDSDSNSDCNDTAKSVVFSSDGMSAIAGTAEGSLFLLSFNSNMEDVTARNILRR
jgi:HELP motif